MAKSCKVRKGRLGGLSGCIGTSGKNYAAGERRAAHALHEKTEAKMRAAQKRTGKFRR